LKSFGQSKTRDNFAEMTNLKSELRSGGKPLCYFMKERKFMLWKLLKVESPAYRWKGRLD
jgi:hypothetical protein